MQNLIIEVVLCHQLQRRSYWETNTSIFCQINDQIPQNWQEGSKNVHFFANLHSD
jgi:hypothetical protein